MRRFVFLALPFAALALGTSPASAVNVCHTDTLTCATTMPVGGYCECTAKGKTEGGDVVERAQKGRKVNSTAGGCGAQPNECR